MRLQKILQMQAIDVLWGEKNNYLSTLGATGEQVARIAQLYSLVILR